ncbi:MAG: AMP-binding protein, partial [Promethearchaeota archaeon]
MKITTNVPLNSPWYGKFWPSSSPKQLEYDNSETMYDILVRNAKEIPDYPVMWFLDTWVNYKQLKEMVDRVATGFSNLGFKKGDVLGVILPNSIQFVVTYYAAFKLGIIVTPVNPTYKLAEVRHQLSLTKAKYIFVLDALYPHLVEPIEEELGIEQVIVTNLVDMATGMSTIKRWLGKILKKIPSAKVPGAIQFNSLLKFPPNTPRAEINALEDTSVLLMTGGTTGIPKAAKLSFSNLCANAIQSVGALAKQRENEDSPIIGPKTGNICVLPLFHSFALTAIMNFAIASKGWIVLFPKPPATKEFCETMEKLPDYNGYIYCAAEVLFQR